MKTFLSLCLVAVLLGCASTVTAPPAPTATPQGSAAPKSGKLRINLSTSRTIANIPTRMAIDTLRAQGYSVETIPFTQFNLLPVALVNGELDISTGSNQTMWQAIAKEAKIHAIVGWTNNPYYLVAAQPIKSCADLAGKRLGASGSRGISMAMLTEYLGKRCGNAKPTILSIASSDARLPGLLNGDLEAAQLELDDVLELELRAPGKFTRLVQFGTEFPGVAIGSFYVSNAFAAENPELVRDFIRALLEAQRAVQDANVLKDKIVAYYQMDAAAAQESGAAYLQAHAWDLNGGLTAQDIQTTMDFLVQTRGIEHALTAPEVADLSYLNAVLAQIGRK